MIIRRDLPQGAQLAQTIHAAGESGPAQSGTYAVALSARNEAELLKLHEKLSHYGVKHVLIREPDSPYNGAAMAIGIPPQSRGSLRRYLKEFRTCQES